MLEHYDKREQTDQDKLTFLPWASPESEFVIMRICPLHCPVSTVFIIIKSPEIKIISTLKSVIIVLELQLLFFPLKVALCSLAPYSVWMIVSSCIVLESEVTISLALSAIRRCHSLPSGHSASLLHSTHLPPALPIYLNTDKDNTNLRTGKLD